MRMINRRVAALAAAAIMFMIPWMVFLGVTLPPRYEARHWQLLWIGFDVFEVAALAHVAWSAWFRRQVTLVSTIVVATLLFSDAWFDVITSFGSRDEWVTLATAFAGELPLALFFFWIARRILVRMVTALHIARGGDGPPPRLRDARILAHAIGPGRAPTEDDLPMDDRDRLRGGTDEKNGGDRSL